MMAWLIKLFKAEDYLMLTKNNWCNLRLTINSSITQYNKIVEIEKRAFIKWGKIWTYRKFKCLYKYLAKRQEKSRLEHNFVLIINKTWSTFLSWIWHDIYFPIIIRQIFTYIYNQWWPLIKMGAKRATPTKMRNPKTTK